MSADYEKNSQIIKNESAKYEKLKKVFSNIYNAEKKSSQTRRDNFDKMNGIKETDNKSLKSIYEKFIKEMKDCEDDRDTHLKKINDLIIPVTEYYPTILKENQKALEDYSKQKKITDDLQKSTRSNQGDITASRREENRKRTKFVDGFQKYKLNMKKDNTYLFLHFIHSELKYHCEALERMSNLFFEINKINPDTNIDDLAKSLGIQNFDYSNLNIDIKGLKKKKNEEEKKQKEEKDKQFDDDDDDNDNDNEQEEEEGNDGEEKENENETSFKESKKKSKNSLKKSKKSNKNKSRKKDDDDDEIEK